RVTCAQPKRPNSAANHWAAARQSAACSGSVLTLGMDRKSPSSCSKRSRSRVTKLLSITKENYWYRPEGRSGNQRDLNHSGDPLVTLGSPGPVAVGVPTASIDYIIFGGNKCIAALPRLLEPPHWRS